jgi:hypothetical protein
VLEDLESVGKDFSGLGSEELTGREEESEDLWSLDFMCEFCIQIFIKELSEAILDFLIGKYKKL